MMMLSSNASWLKRPYRTKKHLRRKSLRLPLLKLTKRRKLLMPRRRLPRKQRKLPKDKKKKLRPKRPY